MWFGAFLLILFPAVDLGGFCYGRLMQEGVSSVRSREYKSVTSKGTKWHRDKLLKAGGNVTWLEGQLGSSPAGRDVCKVGLNYLLLSCNIEDVCST